MRPALRTAIAARLPILTWGRRYSRAELSADLIAAVIVTIMLIPQSLAYALLALTLAFLSGLMLVAMGIFRLGFIANFLSHTVVSGFITASGILIAASQLKSILGIRAEGDTLPSLLPALVAHLPETSLPTLLIGALALAFLFWVRRGGLKRALVARGLAPGLADVAGKAGPVAAVVGTTLATWALGLADRGVAVVGHVPQSLPPFTLPGLSPALLRDLFLPALLISIIGFVESISVAQTLAAKRRQRIDPDQELLGLGAANLGAAFTGGYPVTGGFARSVVNFDAGAATPAAGAFTALGLAFAALALTPLIFFLPKATLAATIIVAVLGLVDLSVLKRSWAYSRGDFAAVLATILATLGLGVEAGVSTGVLVSLLLFLWHTSRPHVAEVGLVPGTEHFRNIRRHAVLTDPSLVTLRVDESLYFANARRLEDLLLNRVAPDCPVKHVVLMCTAVNEIDLSALEALEAINARFRDMGEIGRAHV